MLPAVISLLFLSGSVLASPVPQEDALAVPTNTTSLNSTGAASPDASPQAGNSSVPITLEAAEADPDAVVAEILAQVEAENATDDSSTSTNLVTPDGHKGKGGKGGGGVGGGVGGGPPNSFLNVLLAAIGKTPLVGLELKVIGDVLTKIEAALAAKLGVNTVENGPGCTPVTVIFARGTTEPGNVGLVTGPPFFAALRTMLGVQAVTVQGVDYSASIEGFLEGGDPAGGRMMAQLVKDSLAKCPQSKVVMSGYSQGGQVVHNAANLLGATMSQVNSAVIFGDPDFGKPVDGIAAAKTKIICHPDDNICQHGDLILLSHLTYGENAAEAAAFVSAVAGLGIGNL